MKQIIMLLSALLLTCCSQESDAQAEIARQTDVGSTLIVYYSYTGNCREIASSLSSLIEADVAEVLTVAENQDYNANGYKLRMVENKELCEMEPHIAKDLYGALYTPPTGSVAVSPYKLCFAFIHSSGLFFHDPP